MEYNSLQLPWLYVVRIALDEGKPIVMVWDSLSRSMSSEYTDDEMNAIKSAISSIWPYEQEAWEIHNNRLWTPAIKYINPHYYE